MMKAARIFVSALLLLCTICAGAQNTATQENKKKQLEKEIAQLQQQIGENSARSKNALSQLTLIRKQLSNRRELLAQSEQELARINDSVAVARKQANQLQARLDTMTVYFNRLVRGAYRNRDARVWYMHLLTSANFGQATRRYAYLRRLSGELNSQATDLKQMQEELAGKLAELEAMRSRAVVLRAQRQTELAKLQQEEKRSDDLIAQLNRNKTRYQKELNTKRRQVEALNKEIERIIAEHMAKPSAGSGKSKKKAAPIDYTLAAEFEANKGKLPWPADGPVVDKFGRQYHPVYKSLVMPFNNGVNIGLAVGSDVLAVFDGEVKSIIVMPGYNKCILVQHGNYFSFYCKMGSVAVKSGDKVKTGQRLGTVDTIDGETQLHFQVWKESTPQNPELWLRPR